MNARAIVDTLLEDVPDVRTLHKKLAWQLGKLHRKAKGSGSKLKELVDSDPLLSPYVTIKITTSHTGGGSYNQNTRKITLHTTEYLHDLAQMTETLEHEMVHAEQHKRSGYRKMMSPNLLRMLRRYKANPTDHAARFGYENTYLSEPVETQAHGVNAASQLRDMPPHRAKMELRRGGPSDAPHYRDFYRVRATPKAYRRFMKNMYKSYHQESRDEYLRSVIANLNQFQTLLLALDVAVTGVPPERAVSQYHHLPDSIEKFIEQPGGNPMIYLSDGGYSRIVWSTDTGNLWLTSNSSSTAKANWEKALPQREAFRNYCNTEYKRALDEYRKTKQQPAP